MIPGHSGAELLLGFNVVTKSGSERLRKSCHAQQECCSLAVQTPKVLATCGDEKRFAFSMERIHEATTVFDADDACMEKVFLYVRECLDQSRICILPAQVFVDKIRSIKGVNAFSEAKHLIDRFEFADTIDLLCGPMHGDLTFCNILCRDTDVWLIDFLDGIISSPVMDVAKMRQDTFHGWITLFEDVDTKYVDDHILNSFGNLPWLREMTLLSLLRIIPYAKTPQIFDFLKREIPRAYDNLDSRR